MTIEASYAGYASVADLSAASDLVALVTVTSELGGEIDRGGLPEQDPLTGAENHGIPLVFYEVKVEKSVGVEPVGDSFVVATLAPGAAVATESEPGVEITVGSRIVMFLEHRDRESAPGIAGYAEFYVPTAGPNGLFDVDSDIARPRAVVAVLDGPTTTQIEEDGQMITVGLPVSKGFALADVLAQARSSLTEQP